MPAVEAIGDDPQELRRSLRDLVAVSILPAVWRNYNAQQIAESLTEVLVRMLGLEFAYMSVRWGDDPAVRVARTSDRTAARSDGVDPARARQLARPVCAERSRHARQSPRRRLGSTGVHSDRRR